MNYVSFTIDDIAAAVIEGIDRKWRPHRLFDERARLCPEAREFVLACRSSRTQFEIVVFTSVDIETGWTRPKGADRVRFCFHRPADDTWIHFVWRNRTDGCLARVTETIGSMRRNDQNPTGWQERSKVF